jgi:hypothetical protein
MVFMIINCTEVTKLLIYCNDLTNILGVVFHILTIQSFNIWWRLNFCWIIWIIYAFILYLTGNTPRLCSKDQTVRETIAVYCENHTKHSNTLCVHIAEFQYVKAGGIYSNHWALKDLKIWTMHFKKLFILNKHISWKWQLMMESVVGRSICWRDWYYLQSVHVSSYFLAPPLQFYCNERYFCWAVLCYLLLWCHKVITLKINRSELMVDIDCFYMANTRKGFYIW